MTMVRLAQPESLHSADILQGPRNLEGCASRSYYWRRTDYEADLSLRILYCAGGRYVRRV
jgi:hypothetical protein